MKKFEFFNINLNRTDTSFASDEKELIEVFQTQGIEIKDIKELSNSSISLDDNFIGGPKNTLQERRLTFEPPQQEKIYTINGVKTKIVGNVVYI